MVLSIIIFVCRYLVYLTGQDMDRLIWTFFLRVVIRKCSLNRSPKLPIWIWLWLLDHLLRTSVDAYTQQPCSTVMFLFTFSLKKCAFEVIFILLFKNHYVHRFIFAGGGGGAIFSFVFVEYLKKNLINCFIHYQISQ